MSFRKIRPSFGNSSGSTNNPQSTPESTGSDPSRARGEKEAENTMRRRKVPESITRNACLNCKKARAKCDGKTPCQRCATRIETFDCVYKIHIKHAKEELVTQIKQLKAKDHLIAQIFQALSTDEKVPEILDRLKNRETYESIVEWLGRTPMEDFEMLSPRDSQHSALQDSDHEMADSNSHGFRWTSITSNPVILDHLFQLYFAWVHPVHTLFSEGHFVGSYRQKLDHYCSSVLANALCAMACHLHSTADRDDVNFVQLGDEFSDAVRARIDPEDSSITTLQAFAVMFLVDLARGNGLRAASYLKVATRGISRVSDYKIEGFREVWKDTVRGIRNLNVEWAQVTFQVPPTINTGTFDGIDGNEDKLDEAKWHFYRYANVQCPSWSSFLATTNREKSKLIAIIQDATTAMYAPQGPQLSAHYVLQLYSRFVTWRGDLPSSIGNIGSNSQALPHVLTLLILYSSSVIQLLRPLLNFEGFPSSLVEDNIWNHAQQGLSLLDEHYRIQYTCRYQPALQIFALLHLTDVVARFSSRGIEGRSMDGPEAIQFGMEVLKESGLGFPIAGHLQEMLRRTANECSIRLPSNLNELMAGPQQPKRMYQMDDFIDACTRPTYVQPVNEIHPRYLPSFSGDWIANSGAFCSLNPTSGVRGSRIPSAEEIGAQSLMQIRNLLNTN